MKLGGGLIAPKDREMATAEPGVVKRLCTEIKMGLGGRRLLMASGSGNFGHAAVKKYGINTPLGVARVQRVAQKIGEIVTGSLLDMEIPAVLFSPHDLWENGDVGGVSDALRAGQVPVLYGDVVWEGGRAVIYSGETCFGKLVPGLVGVEKIIQVSCEDGVWDENKEIIPEINAGNWEKIKRVVGRSTGVDYTGGMLHKVEESLDLASKFGIKTWIISGKVEGRLKDVLEGKEVLGTVVG